MATSRTVAIKFSVLTAFMAGVFVLPSFAFAQVYGGGNYGGGNYNAGDIQVSTGSVSSGGGVVIGNGPNSIGYVNNSSTSTPISAVPPTSTKAALTEAQIQSIISILQSFGADQSVIDSVSMSLRGAGSPSPTSGGTFTRDLEWGMEGEDVKVLQQYLNTHGYLLANYGVGSPGYETTYFGDATRYELKQFQKANNISPAAGYFGPKTRAFIDSQ